jgi:predicted protein tyrosine phosphatase
MVKIITLKLVDIVGRHGPQPSLAKICRIYNSEGQRDLLSYILPAQAVILSHIALHERKLSLAEKDIMESLGNRLYSLGEGDIGKVTDEARNAIYEFLW